MNWTETQFAKHQERVGASPCAGTAPSQVVLDLPPPVSVNRIWRKTKAGVIKSKNYERWIKRADAMLLELAQLRGAKTIAVKFTAMIVVKRSNLDLDNNAKCVLDYLQSRRFILNDNLCEELTLCWGDAPTGCRVTVKALPTLNDVLRAAAERMEGKSV